MKRVYKDKAIVIASKNVKDYLLTIGLRGLTTDEIVLHWTDKYTGTAEYLLRILRKSFGWVEKERDKKETMNLKCLYDEIEIKTCKTCRAIKVTKKCTHPKLRVAGGCQEGTRASCKGYKLKYNSSFTVNEAIIVKIPQARL